MQRSKCSIVISKDALRQHKRWCCVSAVGIPDEWEDIRDSKPQVGLKGKTTAANKPECREEKRA
jgi:hypothetical protein